MTEKNLAIEELIEVNEFFNNEIPINPKFFEKKNMNKNKKGCRRCR